MSQPPPPLLTWRSGQTNYGDVLLGEGSLILCAVEYGHVVVAKVGPHWNGGWTSTVNMHKLLGARPWVVAPSSRLAQSWAERWSRANWNRLSEEIRRAPKTIGRARASPDS